VSATSYLLNGLNINNGTSFFVLNKPFDFPTASPALAKIARLEGNTVTGYDIKPRTIPIQVRILGTSRSNLESNIDTLYQALATPNVTLSLHSDGRYWRGTVTDVKLSLASNVPLTAVCTITFTAFQPYPWASSVSANDTGVQQMSGSGPTYTYTYSVTGGGNIWTYPSITVTLKTPSVQGTLTSAYTPSNSGVTQLLCSNPGGTILNNDVFIVGWGNPTQYEYVTATGAYNTGGGYIPISSWTPHYSYASGATVYKAMVLGGAGYTAGGVNNNFTPRTAIPTALSVGDSIILGFGVFGSTPQSLTVSTAASAGQTTSVFFNSVTITNSWPAGTPIVHDIRPTSLTITETTDNRAITVTGDTSLMQVYGDSNIFNCDPTGQLNATGYNLEPAYSVVLNGGSPLAYSGIFPVLQPGATSFTISLTSPSVPSIEVVMAWFSRWVS